MMGECQVNRYKKWVAEEIFPAGYKWNPKGSTKMFTPIITWTSGQGIGVFGKRIMMRLDNIQRGLTTLLTWGSTPS